MVRDAESWTPSQLLSYSEEHVYYEISMFFMCAAMLTSNAARPLTSPFVRNLMIEAFAIHLRGLLEFFTRWESNKADDVLAVDFVDKSQWNPPEVSPDLQEAWTRVNKELGHLTAARKSSTDPSKEWDALIAKVVPEVQDIVKHFARKADPMKLSNNIRSLK